MLDLQDFLIFSHFFLQIYQFFSNFLVSNLILALHALTRKRKLQNIVPPVPSVPDEFKSALFPLSHDRPTFFPSSAKTQGSSITASHYIISWNCSRAHAREWSLKKISQLPKAPEMSSNVRSFIFPGSSQVPPIPANRMALERRSEWFLSIGVEIQRKASIVPDDGVNLLFLNKKTGFFVSTKIPQFFHSWYSKRK